MADVAKNRPGKWLIYISHRRSSGVDSGMRAVSRRAYAALPSLLASGTSSSFPVFTS